MATPVAWSFGIFTDGHNNLHFHRDIVESILNNVRSAEIEIIFVTENPNFTYIHEHASSCIRVLCVDRIDGPISSIHCHKKNEFAKHATHENLCILHDYIVIGENFVQSFDSFGDDWDVCSIPLIMPNGKRWWDWRIEYPQHNNQHYLVSYDCPATKYHFVTGNLFMAKRQFLRQHPMKDDHGSSEDYHWSKNVCNVWKYRMNKHTVARSLKHKDIDASFYNMIVTRIDEHGLTF